MKSGLNKVYPISNHDTMSINTKPQPIFAAIIQTYIYTAFPDFYWQKQLYSLRKR